jgi:hypothetical protein
MIIIVKSDETIFDVALLAYGDVSKVYDLISENPDKIENVISDLTSLNLTYTPSAPEKKEATITVKSTQKNVTMLSSQTLFDIALQYYGSAENVYDLIAENPSIENILDLGYIGMSLSYTESKTMAPIFFRNNNLTVSSRYPYYDDPIDSYLQQEDSFYILQENGFKIII